MNVNKHTVEVDAVQDELNNDDVDDELEDDDVDDEVIDLLELFPNSDDNPIEYIYHRDASGRVIAVDMRLKALSALGVTGNPTTGTASNNTVAMNETAFTGSNRSTIEAASVGPIHPDNPPFFERILTTDEFAEYVMSLHRN